MIDQTSGVPDETRAMAERLAGQGVDMMDAAVSASPPLAAAGGATLMVAGPASVRERAAPLLREAASAVLVCGDRVGDGQATKMVNNAMNAACRMGTLELVALGRKMGLGLPAMITALNAGPAANQTTERMLPAIEEGRQSTDFGLALMLKDLDQALSLGLETGVPMPIVAAVRSLVLIGLNTLPPGARLEDMIGVVESMAATRLPGEGVPGLGADAMPAVAGAVEALGTTVTLECVGAGLRYGLTLASMAPILVRASGWSGPLRRLLPAMAAGEAAGLDNAALVGSVRAAAVASLRVGAPVTILNAVRAILEAALGQAGPSPAPDALLRFYERCAGVGLGRRAN